MTDCDNEMISPVDNGHQGNRKMSGKFKKMYEALVEGAQSGLTDVDLLRHVVHRCPKATSKKIVKASLLALGDAELNDAAILRTIYALAIKHRVEPLTKADIEALEETPKAETSKPSKKARAHREARSSKDALDHGNDALPKADQPAAA
jgi:hypothetical protein